MKKLNQNGFTLIELMIVVVIIGILAAVAIPNFIKYQMRSKASESTRNIGAIKTNEEAFVGKYNCNGSVTPGCYVVARSHPVGAVPSGIKTAWTVAAGDKGYGFDLLGFTPSGSVYFQYSTRAFQSPATLTLTAASCAGAGIAATVAANADSYMTVNATTEAPVVAQGISKGIAAAGAAAPNVIMWVAEGDIDADTNTMCYIMGDVTGELTPVPGSSGESIF